MEDIQYELDNPNLKKVTGLKKLVGKESDDEEEEDGECNEEVGAGKIRGDKGEECRLDFLCLATASFSAPTEKEAVAKQRKSKQHSS